MQKGENIVVFPENSENGYLEELEGFHAGFVLLAEMARKNGMDVPIYVTYFKKKEKVYIIDKPVFYSQLCKSGATKEEIAKVLLDKCNNLGKMKFEKENVEVEKK